MSDHSAIEWTEATWNPIVGCSILSPGCTNCYAMKMAARIEKMGTAPHYAGTTKPSKAGVVWTGKLALAPEHILTQPLRWKKPRTIFVNSMGDLFHEDVPDEWIDRVFAVMALSPQHTFQVLTKRSERMRDYIDDFVVDGRILVNVHRFLPTVWRVSDVNQWGHVLLDEIEDTWHLDWPLPNVWLGVSAERQQEADERIPDLLATPAAIRFVSAEPLLGPIDFESINDGLKDGARLTFNALNGLAHDGEQTISGVFDQPDPKLDGIIVGGESGKGARPMHPDWARSIRDQCAAAGVPFFFKQWGAHKVVYDRDVEDPDWRKCSVIRRSYPAGRWLDLAGGHGFHGKRVLYVVPTIKQRAGRLLDGIEHNGMPGRP